MSELQARASEIAAFLGIPVEQAIERLSKGFGYQHQAVNDDFRRVNPQGDEALLNWYRTTEEYIWELSAYHMDPGFNYAGMCGGIAERLKNEGVQRVLCLGDGIGDLTLALHNAGFMAFYHDLHESRTMQFARHRITCRGLLFAYVTTGGWEPDIVDEEEPPFDAVVSLDFLEHVTDVPVWCKAIHAALKPGGLLCCQNAFDCGSGPDGAIPCHLAVNDKYAHAAPGTDGMALWDHLLIRELGFEQLGSNWYRKPA